MVGFGVEPGDPWPSSTFSSWQIVVKRMAARSHQESRDRWKAAGRNDDDPIDRVADPACLAENGKEATRGTLCAIVLEEPSRPIETGWVGHEVGSNGLDSTRELATFPG